MIKLILILPILHLAYASESSCFANCKRFNATLDAYQMYKPHVNLLTLYGMYDVDRLDASCSSYDEYKACVDGCEGESSIEKKVMQSVMENWKYMCKGSQNFRTNAGCLHGVIRGGSCERTTNCGRIINEINRLEASYIPRGNETRTNEVYKSVCGYMKCAMDCYRPTVVETCGQDAMTDIENLVIASGNAVKELCAFNRPNETPPSECEDLFRMRKTEGTV